MALFIVDTVHLTESVSTTTTMHDRKSQESLMDEPAFTFCGILYSVTWSNTPQRTFIANNRLSAFVIISTPLPYKDE